MSDDLKQEWMLLQNQFDSYEKFSLIIKLQAIAITFFIITSASPFVFSILLLGVIWLLDAIWKTFQSRIEVRLINIERALAVDVKTDESITAFQFNSQFKNSKGGVSTLLKEYLSSGARPSVAIVHLACLGVIFLSRIF